VWCVVHLLSYDNNITLVGSAVRAQNVPWKIRRSPSEGVRNVRHNKTVPNQMHQPTQRPTLRWVFQLLEGIHRVRVTVQGHVHDLIEGLNEVQITILRLFGEGVCRLYQISPG